MTAWRYARVSTADQHLDAQVDALRAAGVDEAHLVTEHASGARARQADADALTDTAGAIMTTARTLEATAACSTGSGRCLPPPIWHSSMRWLHGGTTTMSTLRWSGSPSASESPRTDR